MQQITLAPHRPILMTWLWLGKAILLFPQLNANFSDLINPMKTADHPERLQTHTLKMLADLSSGRSCAMQNTSRLGHLLQPLVRRRSEA